MNGGRRRRWLNRRDMPKHGRRVVDQLPYGMARLRLLDDRVADPKRHSDDRHMHRRGQHKRVWPPRIHFLPADTNVAQRSGKTSLNKHQVVWRPTTPAQELTTSAEFLPRGAVES